MKFVLVIVTHPLDIYDFKFYRGFKQKSMTNSNMEEAN